MSEQPEEHPAASPATDGYASRSPRQGHPAAPSSEIRARPGDLAAAAPDTMVLHTGEALRMFSGRPGDRESGVPAIKGARQFGAVTQALFRLSALGNPYADAILARTDEALARLRTDIAAGAAESQGVIERLGRKGLHVSVLQSRQPTPVTLGFGNPYGYAAAEAVLEFDHFVRLAKTLVSRNQWSDAEGRSRIRETARRMRGVFVLPVRWERVLLLGELRGLSRDDYLPDAGEAARARVIRVRALLGELPPAVLSGEVVPRYSPRPRGAKRGVPAGETLEADAPGACPGPQP